MTLRGPHVTMFRCFFAVECSSVMHIGTAGEDVMTHVLYNLGFCGGDFCVRGVIHLHGMCSDSGRGCAVMLMTMACVLMGGISCG